MTYRIVVALVAAALVTAGCAADSPSAAPWDRHDFGRPGVVHSVTANVEFYPACGNETLTFDGTTWYQYDPANIHEFPDPERTLESWLSGGSGESDFDDLIDSDADAAAAELSAVAGGGGGALAMTRGVPAVALPEPGDDVGVLIVYAGDIAYWQSQSQVLATWLTTTPIEYNWVC